MELLGFLIMIVGGAVSVMGGVWFLYVAFQESFLWLIGCLFVPFVALIFLVLNWSEAKAPFALSLAGSGILALGCLIAGVDFSELRN